MPSRRHGGSFDAMMARPIMAVRCRQGVTECELRGLLAMGMIYKAAQGVRRRLLMAKARARRRARVSLVYRGITIEMRMAYIRSFVCFRLISAGFYLCRISDGSRRENYYRRQSSHMISKMARTRRLSVYCSGRADLPMPMRRVPVILRQKMMMVVPDFCG